MKQDEFPILSRHQITDPFDVPGPITVALLLYIGLDQQSGVRVQILIVTACSSIQYQ